MATPTASHTVAFAGCRSGDYGLTWAQQSLHHWTATDGGDPAALNVPRAGWISGAAGLDGVLAAARAVLVRHDSLRTRFYPGPDGELRQEVLAHGELRVDVYDAAAGAVDAVKDEVDLLLRRHPFATSELPVRMAVITDRGTPAMMALAFHHLAVDAESAGLVLEEMARLCTDPAAPLATGWQIADVLRYEHSERGQRQAQRAARYWRDQLRQAPGSLFPVRRRAVRATSWEYVLRSPAAAAAIHRLARRYRSGELPVLFAAFALMVGTLSGRTRCTVNLASANRLEPELAAAVGNFFQYAPATVDTSGTFGELVARARASSLSAYRFGNADPVRIARARADVRRERGVVADLSCALNFGFRSTRPYAGPVEEARRSPGGHASADTVRGLLGRTEIEFVSARPPAQAGLYLAVWWLADRAVMTLTGDAGTFTREEVGSLTGAVERLLVEAGCAQGDPPTADLVAWAGLAPVPPAEGLRLVHRGWIDAAHVAGLVAAAVPAREIRVFAAGGALECYVVPDDPGLSPARAHASCVAALFGRPFAMAPDRYVICVRGPERLESLEAWRSVPVLAEGTGRPDG